jgi:hypothetical protein
LTGPGAVMVGVSIGSGELILWPWITAKFGADMAWAAALGVFLQLWINIEIGRWAIATGESAMTGFARVSRVAIYFFVTLLAIQALLPGWARATGAAFKFLFFGIDAPGADWMWTAFVFLLVALLLFGPKRIYSGVELAISAMVLVIVCGMVFVALRVGTLSDAGTLAKGALSVGTVHFDDEFTPLRFFGAVVFAGAGGFGNLFYAYYLRDKGIGMGARIPMLVNPLRGEGQRETELGYTFPDNEENRRRFRDWFSYVKQDTVLYFWLLNTFTMFLFMFGALVVLHPLAAVPAEGRLVWDLAQMLETSMGTGGRYLFLVIGMAALFSTQVTVVDGAVRMWTDVLHTNVAATRKVATGQLYFGLAIALMGIGVASTWFFDTFQVSALDFLFLNAVSNGFAMAVYVPLILYLNLKLLPPAARPKPLNIVMVGLGASVYISFALYTVGAKIASWLG